MRRVVMSLLLILVLSSCVLAVPYPYGNYDLDTTRDLETIYDEIRSSYTVLASAEQEYYPWTIISFALMQAPAVVDARINMRAEFQFWTEAEKAQERKEQFEYVIDDSIVFNLTLSSDPEVSRGYRYVDVEDTDSQIDRIMLETNDGKRYLSEFAISFEPELVNDMWFCENLVVFPRYDNGAEIIGKETEWIKIWVIAGMNRIYFQFDFD